MPEGLSIREAAPVVDKAPLKGSYRKAASSAATLQPRSAGSARRKGTNTGEGFLFPATYTWRRAPARDLVAQQLAAFEDAFAEVDMSYAERKNLTPYDVLMIASMIEREARVDSERKLIAAVIYNRLKLVMPLGIDATLLYDGDLGRAR